MSATTTESRLKLVDPATATGEAKEILDGPLKGKHFNIFKAMVNSPAAMNVYLGMSGALAGGELSGKEREVIQLSVGQDNNCDYCLAAHTAIGKGEGLTEDETLGARRGSLDDAKLDAIAKFTKALQEKKGFVSDEDLERVRAAGYGDGAIAEIVAGFALATYTNYFNHVAATPIDFPEAKAL